MLTSKAFLLSTEKSFPHHHLRRKRFDEHWMLTVETHEKHDFNLTLVNGLKASNPFFRPTVQRYCHLHSR